MHISRRFIQDNPTILFVFGDNTRGEGYGGQARDARGEPNAVGLPTKWAPTNHASSFFYDAQFDKIKPIIDNVFKNLTTIKLRGTRIVFFPNIGEGLAKLPYTAPKTLEYIKTKIKRIEEA